jgi:hypothetical protein
MPLVYECDVYSSTVEKTVVAVKRSGRAGVFLYDSCPLLLTATDLFSFAVYKHGTPTECGDGTFVRGL